MKKKRGSQANRRNTRRREKGGLLHARTPGVQHRHFFRNVSILLIVLILVALSWGGYLGVTATGRHLFTENDQYRIRHLDLSSDGILRPDEIHEYVPYLRVGANLFERDMQSIREDLMSVSIVESVEIRRILPDALQIRITERVPLARVRPEGQQTHWAVDRRGNVLVQSFRPTLPTITGFSHPGLRPNTQLSDPLFVDALLALDLCDHTPLGDYIKIKSMDVSDREILTLWLHSGEQVKLKRENLAHQLNTLALTLRRARQSGILHREIDVTGSVVATR